MNRVIYQLSSLKRILHSPFPLSQIGWMPHHQTHHQNTVLHETFFCFSFNRESESPAEDAKLRYESSTFSMIPPGTCLTTHEAHCHDELFFVYPADIHHQWQDIFGCNSFKFKDVAPDSDLKLIIGQIRENLNNLHETGAADNLDRLAFSFITGMFIAESTRQTQNPQNDFRLQELAAELLRGVPLEPLIRKYGFSRRNFFRLWNDFCPQQSPTQYRLAHQFAKAEALLRRSDLPIAEIAALAGFSSTIYFCRIFKQHHGCTASDYRLQEEHMDVPGF